MRVPRPCTHPKPCTGSHTWGSPSHPLPGPARRAPQGRHHPGLCAVAPMPGPPPAGSPHTQGSEVRGRAPGPGPQEELVNPIQGAMADEAQVGTKVPATSPSSSLRGSCGGRGGGAGGALQGSSDSRAGSLTPDHLSNLPGVPTAGSPPCRPGWQSQDGACAGGTRPVESSCPTSPAANPPDPHPAPFPAPPWDTCPAPPRPLLSCTPGF